MNYNTDLLILILICLGFGIFMGLCFGYARRRAYQDNIKKYRGCQLDYHDTLFESYRLMFQSKVKPWLYECFGQEIAENKAERNYRFLEEALELVQSCGLNADEAHKLVKYVYGRETGEPGQETGGVMVTLAALCIANNLNMHYEGELELSRIWSCMNQIREKQKNKPHNSPLPGNYGDEHDV